MRPASSVRAVALSDLQPGHSNVQKQAILTQLQKEIREQDLSPLRSAAVPEQYTCHVEFRGDFEFGGSGRSSVDRTITHLPVEPQATLYPRRCRTQLCCICTTNPELQRLNILASPMAGPQWSGTRPLVTMVVPCRNEKSHIEACIRTMLAQEPPAGGFELIVADGMSDDGTREILDRLVRNGAFRLVDNKGRTTPCGMNAGIFQAKGAYVAIMGAHNRYPADYIMRGTEILEQTGADNVGGAIIFCGQTTWLQRAIAATHHSAVLGGGARWHNPDYDGPADTVFGGIYRREVFERIGLFDEQFVQKQDDEFNLRLTRAGGTIWQSPKLKTGTRRGDR